MYTVVIIDDEPWALQGLAEIIDWEAAGFSIEGKFTNSEEAFAFLCEKEPDVVFTDVRMPGVSGLDLIEMSQRKGLKCEFVLISSYEDFEAAQRAIRLHVWECVLKPYNAYDIQNIARVLLRHLRDKPGLSRLDWNASPEEILRGSETLRKRIEGYQSGVLYLCSRPSEMSGGVADGKCVPLLVNGVGSAFLVVSSEPQEAWPAFPSDERKQWGASREHRNIMASLPKMLQEAWYSLWCGFSYSSKENVGEIQFYLCKNMKEELSLGKLAERFHFSEAYFCALFKKGTGMSVIHFIQYVRIHYGAYLIRNERKKLQEVSEQVGFENYSYFGKLFKKYIGQTPETYRGESQGNLGI